MKKQLWLLKALEVNFEDETLVVASSEEEANKKWDDFFGDSDYLGRVVTLIDFVDAHEIIVLDIKT